MSIDTFLLSSDTTDLNYPEVRPTLDLNFARVKALDPRITFTRASGGSYVGADGLIKYAGVNEPRFDHDPVTGESLGFLVEEARTNLLLRSAQIGASPWEMFGNGGNSTAFVPNAIVSPDGSMSATKAIISRINNDFTGVYQTFGAISGTYTFSVWMRLDAGTTSKNVNLFTSSGTTGTVTLTDQWQRLSVTFPDVSYSWVGIGNYYNNIPSNWIGSTPFYIWGAQLEAGAFPTSYIPTEGSTRTRAGDVASMTGKNFSSWYRQDEGTLFVNFNTPAKDSSAALQVLSIRNSTPTEFIEFYIGNTNTEAITLDVAAGRQFAFYTRDTVDIGKYALALKANNFAVSKNGLTPLTDTSGSMTSLVDRLFIGTVSASSYQLNGTIARLTYYPKRLTDAQLQVLTR